MERYGLGLTWRIFKVPVIAVFTKYDQFRREVRMKLEDRHCDQGMNVDDQVESIFNQHYLACLRVPPLFIRLESEDFVNQMNIYHSNFCPIEMQKSGQHCTGLIKMTAKALSSGVALILLSIQRGNLELNIQYAVEWYALMYDEIGMRGS
jgi:hypothetical protein